MVLLSKQQCLFLKPKDIHSHSTYILAALPALSSPYNFFLYYKTYTTFIYFFESLPRNVSSPIPTAARKSIFLKLGRYHKYEFIYRLGEKLKSWPHFRSIINKTMSQNKSTNRRIKR